MLLFIGAAFASSDKIYTCPIFVGTEWYGNGEKFGTTCCKYISITYRNIFTAGGFYCIEMQ